MTLLNARPLLVGVAIALVSLPIAAVARPGSQIAGLIAFTRDDGVYVVQADGSGVRALWRGTTPTDVAWSPDGARLAFSSGRRIWAVNADGSRPVSIASVLAESLTWSPDGRRIAFTRRHDGDNPDIWVMDANGRNMKRVARTPKLWDSNVDWSPAGGGIALDSGSYFPQIYVIDPDGRNLRAVMSARAFGDSAEPDWSPDGRRIVFAHKTPSPTNDEIWAMDARGKKLARLTRNRVHDGSPAWSPDGRRIAFVRREGVQLAQGGESDLYLMDAEGTGVTRLTRTRVNEGNPAWQPVVREPG